MKVLGKALFGDMPLGQTMVLVIVLLNVSVLAMVAFFGLSAVQDEKDKEYISKIGNQQVLSQEIAKLASQAARGNGEAFTSLQHARDKFEEILNYQKQETPELSKGKMGSLNELVGLWTVYRENVDIILKRGDVVSSMRSHIIGIDEQIPTMLALSDEVVASMAQQGAKADQVYIATRQLMLMQRISSNVSRVLDGGDGAVTAADRFGRDAALFGRVVEDMLHGNSRMRIKKITAVDTRAKLEEVAKQFAEIRSQVGAILERSPEMFLVSSAAEDVLASSAALLIKISDVFTAFEETSKGRLTPLLAKIGRAHV